MIKAGVYSLPYSDLYWRVYKVHHVGETHIKLKMITYYKSNNQICTWLNPQNKAKNFKVIKTVAKHWEGYEKK